MVNKHEHVFIAVKNTQFNVLDLFPVPRDWVEEAVTNYSASHPVYALIVEPSKIQEFLKDEEREFDIQHYKCPECGFSIGKKALEADRDMLLEGIKESFFDLPDETISQLDDALIRVYGPKVRKREKKEMKKKGYEEALKFAVYDAEPEDGIKEERYIEVEYFYREDSDVKRNPATILKNMTAAHMASSYVKGKSWIKYFGEEVIKHVPEGAKNVISYVSGQKSVSPRMHIFLSLKPISPDEFEKILEPLWTGFRRIRNEVITLAKKYDKLLEKAEKLGK